MRTATSDQVAMTKQLSAALSCSQKLAFWCLQRATWNYERASNLYYDLDEQGWKHYELYGPLFFGSTTVFAEKFDIEGDPEHVVLDFAESRVVDMSAIEALNRLTSRYAEAGKKVHLRHLSEDCRRLIDKAEAIIEVNHFEDPTYKVVSDMQ